MILDGYAGSKNQVSVVIPNGQQRPAAGIELKGYELCGLFLRTMTGTAVTFEVCDTLTGIYVPLKTTTSGTALSYTIASDGYFAIDPKDFAGVLYFKPVFGTAQAADRTVVCSLKG